MSGILDRNWVHPSLIIKKPDKGIHKLEFFQIIDYWKETFLKNGVKPGNKIGIALSHMDELYLASIFAALEYRLQIVIILKPDNKKDILNPKYNAFFPLDVCILDTRENLNDLSYEHFSKNSKIIINRNYGYRLPKKISKKVREIKQKEDDICLLCTSSGSTDNPKLLMHTQKFFHHLCLSNMNSLEFEESDHVLHLSTFNHGSAMGIFFLPSIHKSRFHFFHIKDFNPTDDSDENWDKWVIFCQKYKITKVQSIFPGQTKNMISAIKRSKNGLPDLTIMILSFINPDWIETIKENKLKKIISIFGCSETSGPLFLPSIDNKTNEQEFNPYNLGKPVEGFYNISLDVENELTVEIPLYQKIVKTQDFMKIENSNYFFVQKKKLYRINDVDINLLDITNAIDDVIIKKYNSPHVIKNLILLVDEVYNKIYAVGDSEEFSIFLHEVNVVIWDEIHKKVEINDFFVIKNLNNFITGIKLDKEKLITYIRQIKNEQD